MSKDKKTDNHNFASNYSNLNYYQYSVAMRYCLFMESVSSLQQ